MTRDWGNWSTARPNSSPAGDHLGPVFAVVSSSQPLRMELRLAGWRPMAAVGVAGGPPQYVEDTPL